MKLNWTLIVALVAIVLIGATGFVAYNAGYAAGNQAAVNVQREFFQARFGQPGQGGFATQPGQTDTNPQTGQPGQAQRGGPGGQPGQGGQFGRIAAAGTVKSVQGNKIEVTTANGNVVIVTVDQQTQIVKTVSGQVGDLQPGMRIAVTSDQTGNNITGRLITIQGLGVPSQ